jgi:BirA family biotin operon repressor/biotin-[acetyl-CoA-carboxylase] ligase
MTDTVTASIDAEIAGWPDRLEAACAGTRFDPTLVRVVARCDSTQDLARALGLGAVVTTGRQTGGRGRLGRAWLDDEGTGIAVSLVVEVAEPAALALAAGLAGHAAVVQSCPAVAGRLGVKHPNDLVDRVTARKVGGVLVEADGSMAVVGIGLNVRPRSWPPEVFAISIAELVDDVEPIPNRLTILERLIPTLDALLATPLETLAASFSAVHAPTGRLVTVETPSGERRGRLVDYDPRAAILIEDEAGIRHELEAGTSRLLDWSPDR